MSEPLSSVFFYGLFMDEGVLAASGVQASSIRVGVARGYRLRIGDRATMQADAESEVYGLVMDVESSALAALYSEPSVVDYQPHMLEITLDGGQIMQAICYLLPSDDISGANADYAESLLVLASRLGFPPSYLDVILAEGRLS